jgi:hypothetical protein
MVLSLVPLAFLLFSVSLVKAECTGDGSIEPSLSRVFFENCTVSERDSRTSNTGCTYTTK